MQAYVSSLPPRVLNLYYFNVFIEIPIEEYLMLCHSLTKTHLFHPPHKCQTVATIARHPIAPTRILAGKEFLRSKFHLLDCLVTPISADNSTRMPSTCIRRRGAEWTLDHYRIGCKVGRLQFHDE